MSIMSPQDQQFSETAILPDGWQPTRYRRRLLAALGVSVVTVLAGYLNILPIFRGQLQRYLNIDDPQFGLLFGLGPLAATSVIFAGALIGRLGAIRLIRFSLIGIAFGMLIVSAFGNRYAFVLTGCVMSSLFIASLYLANQVYLVRLFPRHRRRILAISMAIIYCGGIVLPLLAEGLLALPGRYEGIVFGHILRLPTLGIAAILLVVSFFYRSKAPIRRQRTVSRDGLRRFLLPLPVAWLLVLLAMHGSVDTAINIWMPKYLAGQSFISHPVVPGLVLSAFSMAYFVSRGILALLPEALGKRALMVLPGLVGGGVFLFGVLSRNFWLSAGGYVFGAFCWSVEYPTMMGILAGCSKEKFGTTLAALQVLTGTLMPSLLYGVGLASGAMGEENLWLVMSVLACGFIFIGAGGGLWIMLWARSKGYFS